MASNVTLLAIGFSRLIQALKLADAGVRSRVQVEIRTTTEAIVRGAKARAPISGPEDRKGAGRPGPGELRNTIRSAYTTDGMVGYAMAGFGKLPRARAGGRRRRRTRSQAVSRRLGAYAVTTEYGSPGRGIPAHPYLGPSREAERQGHYERIGQAIDGGIETAVRSANA